MTAGVFVTGTDTGCGKTHAAVALLRALRRRGLRAAGFKPVAAGATWRDGILQNDDALALCEAAGGGWNYPTVNPYCFAPPIAPHLAASEAGIEILFEPIGAAFAEIGRSADIVVVEGAGGWRVPLGPDWDMSGLAQRLGLPVVMVVGMRLGCLNHALLTEQAVVADGVDVAGWIATQVDADMPRAAENLAALRERMATPWLGYLSSPGRTSEQDSIATSVLGVAGVSGELP